MDIAEVKRQIDILNAAVQEIMDGKKKETSYISDASLPKTLEWGPNEGEMTWTEAVALAKAKGDGWRLPTVAELVSQFDYANGKPKHSSWKSECYWSSSAVSGNPASAWLVYFNSGYAASNVVGYANRVRCVR